MSKQVLPFLLLLALASCSNLEQSENEKMRKQNAKGQYIQRYAEEKQFTLEAPKTRIREPYPWEGEEKKASKPSKTTK